MRRFSLGRITDLKSPGINSHRNLRKCSSVAKQRTLTTFRINTYEGNNILDSARASNFALISLSRNFSNSRMILSNFAYSEFGLSNNPSSPESFFYCGIFCRKCWAFLPLWEAPNEDTQTYIGLVAPWSYPILFDCFHEF